LWVRARALSRHAGARCRCEELAQGAGALAEALGQPGPPDEEPDEGEQGEGVGAAMGLALYKGRRDGDAELSPDAWVFGSEDARGFYMDLPDLVLAVPPGMLKDGVQPWVAQRLAQGPGSAAGHAAASSEEPPAAEPSQEEVRGEEEVGGEEEVQGEEEERPEEMVPAGRPVEELMARLPDLLSARAVDAFALDYCHLHSKSARRRLVQELLFTHWARAELLPFHARLVAVLSSVFSEVGPALIARLRGSFFRMLLDRRPGRLESRLRGAKYLGASGAGGRAGGRSPERQASWSSSGCTTPRWARPRRWPSVLWRKPWSTSPGTTSTPRARCWRRAAASS
jgi:hypothetical protein